MQFSQGEEWVQLSGIIRLADIDPELHEPSLAWGAAKAFVMKARHRELGG